MYEGVVQSLIDELGLLPGVGPKGAQRIAFHLLTADPADVRRLSAVLLEVIEQVKFCRTCGNVAEDDECRICRDQRRDLSVICVVEEPKDVAAIEKIREFRGRYHVLGGAISPIDGIGPEDLRIKELMTRLADGTVTELILATDPNLEGEATATYLARLIKPLGMRVTRPASGLPVGGELEYADEVTLGRAFEGRRLIDVWAPDPGFRAGGAGRGERRRGPGHGGPAGRGLAPARRTRSPGTLRTTWTGWPPWPEAKAARRRSRCCCSRWPRSCWPGRSSGPARMSSCRQLGAGRRRRPGSRPAPHRPGGQAGLTVDEYAELFDPYADTRATPFRLSDDLAAVAADLIHGLRALRGGPLVRGAVVVAVLLRQPLGPARRRGHAGAARGRRACPAGRGRGEHGRADAPPR